MYVRVDRKGLGCAFRCAQTVGYAHWCWGSVLAFVALIGVSVTAKGITLVEGGHTLNLIADSVNPTDASQAILGTNNGVAGLPPTGIESITVDSATGLIYVQVIDSPGACPSTTTAIYQITPAGFTTVINPATGFGVCARGTDIDIADIPGITKILTVENEFAALGGSEIATVSLPGGILGTWVTPSVFAGNTFGMDFAPGIGVVPAGDIVFVADVGGAINSAAFGGPLVGRALPPGGGDDLYIQPDGDIIFVGDFTVGIHNYNPTTFVPTAAAVPDVQTMFTNAGLTFIFGTRATVCPTTGDGLISYSGFPGGTGVFRVNEPLTSHNLVLTMASDEGIHDITVGPASDGSGNSSLYMTVENYTSGAHQVWEVTNACAAQPPTGKVSKWTQLPHGMGGGNVTMFGSTGNQGATLITINAATGAGTPIGPHGAFGPVTDIDCSSSQVIYGGTGGGTGNLITINPVGPIETLIGNNGIFSSANIGLEWVGATLYATIIPAGGGGAPSSLYTLNPATGVATLVGPTGLGPIGGLASDPVSGIMYGSESGGGSPGNLVTINLATGAATIVGPTGFSDVAALEFHPTTGVLYGGLGGSDPNAPGSLITINPATGAGTLVGPTGFPALSGITFCSDIQLGFDAPSNLWWNKTPTAAGQRVLADDFASRADPAGGFCNEICLVTWKGSYVDPNFPFGTIDGFLISFFTDQPADAVNPSQPKDLIVTYFVDQFEEITSAACPPGCDTHPVFDYNADLRNACIISNPLAIAVLNECLPMPPLDTIWWISVEPVLGFVYTKDPLAPCVQVKTGNSWPNDFWGWHTTPPQFNFNDDAFMGNLSISPAPDKILTYNWLTDLHWFDVATSACLPTDPNLSVNLSFDLHDIQFNNCWNQPACILPPIDPSSAGVDVPTAYQWTGGDVQKQQVNVVVADDFISDGRPITGVRWWGSYFDPQYEPQPLEACCFADGSCQNLTVLDCQAAGGASQGAGTACLGDGNGNGIDDACEQPPQLEACCFADGSCLDLTVTDCQAAGGASQGSGTACLGDGNGNGIDDACEQPPQLEACCFADGSCLDLTVTDCQAAGGASQGSGTACLGDGNGNGIDDACEQPPQCGPDPTAPRCLNVTCPVAGEQCLPTCVLVDTATGVLISVLDCQCMSPNNCHVDIVSGPVPTCVGGCPIPGDVCISTLVDNLNGTSTLCCNCGLPAAGASADGPSQANTLRLDAAPVAAVQEVRGDGFARTTFASMRAFNAAHPVAEPTVVPFNEGPPPQAAGEGMRAEGQDRFGPQWLPAPDGGDGVTPPTALAPALINSFAGTLDDGTFIPPDTMGAAGPNHLVVFLNSGFTIYNKAGGLVAAQITLQSFWNALGTLAGQPASTPFDPKILFDQYSDCWVVTSDGNPNCRDGTGNSWVLVGISATNDPTGAWYLYAIRADVGQDIDLWADYPGLGVDPNNVVVTNNMFLSNCQPSPPFRHADVWVINKANMKTLMGPPAALTLGVDYSLHHNPCGTNGFTFQPCHTFGQTALTAVNYLVDQGWVDVATRARRFLRVKSITGTGAAAVINCAGGNDWVEVLGYNFQILDGPQPSCMDIETNDTRMLDAVVRNGNIFCTHHVGAGAPADTTPPPAATKTEVAWYGIDPTTAPGVFPGGVPNQQGRVANTEVAYYYPSIAVNRLGCIALGFSGSGFFTLPSAFYTMHDPTADPPGVMQPVGLLKAGQATYWKQFGGSRNRWGDFSATCIDPTDDSTFWTIQEYAALEFTPGNCQPDTGRWGTWWGSFTCAAQTGACCDTATGTCTDNVTQAACLNSGGTWFGGQTCASVVCGQTGACCDKLMSTCTNNVTEADCLANLGVWFGGQSCADVNCPVFQVEGWFISFHYDDPMGLTTCPPDALAGVTPTVTGLYFCPASAVQIIDTGMVDCFQHRVFEYEVQLKDCCLICTLPDPRIPGILPAQVDAFNEVQDFSYWLDIQAVVGATFTQVAGGDCQKVITNSVPSIHTANGDFWGWHTSPAVTQPQGPLNDACVGTVLTLPPAAPFCPDYGAWVKQPWLCPLAVKPTNMAFELLTPVCPCPGDMDGNTVLNGLDIQGLVNCLLGIPAPGINCSCADMDGNGTLNLVDVQLFITALLNKTPCP